MCNLEEAEAIIVHSHNYCITEHLIHADLILLPRPPFSPMATSVAINENAEYHANLLKSIAELDYVPAALKQYQRQRVFELQMHRGMMLSESLSKTGEMEGLNILLQE